MTICPEHSTLVMQVNAQGQQLESVAMGIEEIQGHTLAIIRELKGTVGDGESLGIAPVVRDHEKRITALEAAKTESKSRAWDVAKAFLAAFFGAAFATGSTIALVYWGLK